MRFPPNRRVLACLLWAIFTASLVAGEEPELVFSLRTWDGEYHSKDIPGGVETTPSVGAIYRIKADGTGLTKVAQPGKDANAPAFSPDGKWVYFQSNVSGHSQIYRCRPDGSEVVNITQGERLGKSWQEAYGFALSTGGGQLLYTVHDGSTGRVALADPDGQNPRMLFPDLGYTYMGALSPKGDQIVLSGPARGYRLLIADLQGGKPRELTPDHPGSFAPQFTPDGRTIVFIRRDGDVYRVDADGKDVRRLTEGNRYVEFRLSEKDHHGSTDGPHVSPDGERIAYVSRQEGTPNLYVMNLDGSGQKQVTTRKTPCGRVRWSPEGKQLAFVSFEGKYPQLFVVDAAGGEPRKLTDLPGGVHFVNWKP
ncbi:MAG: PD40 domain-containing protein [Pirellulaceae bacterium]|nr:PD40 domain-containing protein [Pirellulaceae bacterium]